MSNQKKMNGSVIAIITMFFLYAMIAFVTNLGAPIGVIWKNQPGIDGNNMLGMMGNFMNFFRRRFCWRADTVSFQLPRGHSWFLCLSARRIHLWFLCVYSEHRGQPDA